MKFFLISLFIATISFGDTIDIQMNMKVEQNIKALYKDLNLTKEQKAYIEESEEQNINAINRILIKEALNIMYITKNIDDKNIVQFELNPNGIINNIELISKSDNKQIDKTTKNTIEKINNQLVLPKEKITLRYIFRYDIKNKNTQVIQNYQKERNIDQLFKKNEIYIQRGTTRFEHSSNEYVRIFETNKDGFINFNTNPQMCNKYVALLTENGQKINHGYSYWQFNTEVPKGRYKLLVQTKQTCDINLQYP